MNVIEQEKPIGVIVQFGGQTAINLAAPLAKAGVRILGTDLESIDTAEDRKKFEALLRKLTSPSRRATTVTSVEEAVGAARKLGYPVLVRPSYVLGGRAMEIVYSDEELLSYMEDAVKINPEHPVLIDRYMLGKEVEVDAICDGETVLIPGHHGACGARRRALRRLDRRLSAAVAVSEICSSKSSTSRRRSPGN